MHVEIVLPPPPPITRANILANARAFLTVNWVLQPDNFARTNVENACNPHQGQIWLRPRHFTSDLIGKTIGPMPYRWGGGDTPQTFLLRVEWGALAGNLCTCRDPTLNYCIFADSAGTDCSGFVSTAWGISKRGTSGLLDVADRLKDLSELRPGDAIDWPQHHVRLFVGMAPGPATAFTVLEFEHPIWLRRRLRVDLPAERTRRISAAALPRRPRRCGGKAMMRIAAVMAFVVLLAGATGPPAHAISREDDAIRDLTQTFGSPSTILPNNAFRPDSTIGGEKLPSDSGPGPDERLERVPIRGFPWVVALVDDKKRPMQSFVCAGTVIAPGWVLTAAHCTFSWSRRWPSDPKPYVLSGTENLAKPEAAEAAYAVKRIIVHPDYDPLTRRNDLALLAIETGGKRTLPSLALDGPPVAQQVGQIGNILGWGVSNRSLAERTISESLQILQVVVRDDICYSVLNYPRLRGSGSFCASSLLRYHDACGRFGGGPIVMRDADGRQYLGGIVSWPASCPPVVDKMNVYLDVQKFVPWIRSVIKTSAETKP